MSEFSEFLEARVATNNRLLIVNNTTDRTARQFSDLLKTFDLHQNVHCATHIKGNTLDLIITRSDEELVKDITVTDSCISDHFWVGCSIVGPKPKTVRKQISFRKTKSIDLDHLKNDIHSSELGKTSSFHDVTDLVQQYNQTLNQLLDIHAPVVNKTVVVHPESPWFNNEIKEAKLARRKAEKRWRKSNLTVDRQIFIEKRETVNTLLQKAKENYYSDLIKSSDQKTVYCIK